MPAKRCLVGLRFTRLVVVEEDSIRTNKHIYYLCRCDCGAIKRICGASLVKGSTKSCGCLNHDKLVTRNSTHKQSRTREYRIWTGIISRCYTPSSTSFKYYGALGVTVCLRWRESFEAFMEDMGPSPSNLHSVERRDSAGNYCPDNCYWMLIDKQNHNKSNTIVLDNGKRIPEEAESAGITYSQAYYKHIVKGVMSV